MYSLESKCLPLISGKHFEIISSVNVYFLQTWVMYTFGVIDYCYDFIFNFLFHCQLNSIYWLIVYTLTCDCSCHSMNVEMRGQFAGRRRSWEQTRVARFDKKDCYPLSQREVFDFIALLSERLTTGSFCFCCFVFDFQEFLLCYLFTSSSFLSLDWTCCYLVEM